MKPLPSSIRIVFIVFIMVVLTVFWLGTADRVNAATFVVDATVDAQDVDPGDGVCDDGIGNCTLRAAIQEANAQPDADVISIPEGLYVLTISGKNEDLAATGDLDIFNKVELIGAGPGQTIIDGNREVVGDSLADRVFEVLNTALTLEGVTVRGGASGNNSGGIRNIGGALSLYNVIVESNSVYGIGNVDGINFSMDHTTVRNHRDVTSGLGVRLRNTSAMISNSTIVSNGRRGLVIDKQNSTFNVTVINSSITGHRDQGILFGTINTGRATLTIINSTITDNKLGISDASAQAGDEIFIKSSIVANNTTDCVYDGPTPDINSAGYNISSDTSCTTFTEPTDRQSTDPLLEPLANYGGLTFTHGLQPGSPAIDALPIADCRDENDNPLLIDQRLAPRPTGSACDIGAFEWVSGGPSTDAEIDISPLGINHSLQLNQTGSDTIAVANLGGDTLNWTLVEQPEADWLSATPTSGSLAAGTQQDIQVTLDSAQLPSGLHTTELAITSNDPERPDARVVTHLCVDIDCGAADGPWPMFRRDRQRNAHSSIAGPAVPQLKWTFPTGGEIFSSPAIGPDGTVYVGSNDHYLYAVNPDGSRKWRYATGHLVLSSPAIAGDGTVYVGSRDNRLHAINPDGSPKWTVAGAFQFDASPAIAPDGTIFITGADGRLHVIRPDGTEIIGPRVQEYFFGSPALGADGTVYAGDTDGNLYAFHPDGSLKWLVATAGNISSTPAIAPNGTIYVGTRAPDNKLYAFGPDGSFKWSLAAAGDVYGSPAIGPDGTIYVGSYDNHVYAVNPDGTLQWAYPTDDRIQASPAVDAKGMIYVGSEDNQMYALNADGTLAWTFPLGDRVISSPAIGADGTLYVGSYDDNLYALTSLSAELSITQTDDVDPIDSGQSLTYTLTATNNGPDDATGLVVTDDLPANVTFVSATWPTGLCAEAGGRVTCDIGVLANGDSMTITIVVEINPAAGTRLSNEASVSANERDSDETNDTATETTDVNAVHDIAVTSVSTPGTASVGDTVSVEVEISNQGTVEETVDITLSYTPSKAEPDTEIQTVTAVHLLPGTVQSIPFVWDTTDLAAGDYALPAAISTVPGESDLSDNRATGNLTLLDRHDVAVTLVGAPETASVGDTVSAAIEISNQGTVEETVDVTLSYTPSGAKFDTEIQTVTAVHLLPGTVQSIPFVWDTTGLAAGDYTLLAAVSTVPGESDLSDNNATSNLTLHHHDVAVTSIDVSGTVDVGYAYPVQVTVSNEGNFTETFNVTLAHGSTSIGIESVSNLAPGVSQTLTFLWDTTGVALGRGMMHATADIVAGETDTSDNTRSSTVILADLTAPDLTAPADLTVEATGPAGAVVHYDLPVATDLVDAAPVVQCDPAPGGLFAVGSHQVTCDASDTAGNTNTVAFQVAVVHRHDVAVLNVSAPGSAAVGETSTVTAKVYNQGTATETLKVTLSNGATVIGIQAVLDLAAGASRILVFDWDTTGVPPGVYTLTVTADTVAGETEVGDNSASADIDLFDPDDVDGDGIANDIDVRLVNTFFGPVFKDTRNTPSVYFTDRDTDPVTHGRIIQTGGLFLTVDEVGLAPEDGVRILVSGRRFIEARLNVCGKFVRLTAGEYIKTCSSLRLTVVTGVATVEPAPDIAVRVTDGTTATIRETTPGVFQVENAPDSLGAVEIVRHGQVALLAPGTTHTEISTLAFALYSSGNGAVARVTVGQHATVSNGLVGGHGHVTIKQKAVVEPIQASGDVVVGIKATTGYVTAGGNVTVKRKGATGNLTAGGTVRLGHKVTTGEIVEGASVVPPVFFLPEVDASPDFDNDIVRTRKDARAGPLPLGPGAYGKLDTARKDTIVLHSGEYHFTAVSIGRNSDIIVSLDDADGNGEPEPLIVRVQGKLKFGKRVKMTVIGGDASDVLFLVDGKRAWLRQNGDYLGTFVVPNGQVIIGRKASLTGAAWGKTVRAKQRAEVLLVGYDHQF